MSIVASLVGPVTGLLDKFIEDKDQKNALAHEIATMSERHAQELMKGQLDVNKPKLHISRYLLLAGGRVSVGCVRWAYSTIQLLPTYLGIWVDLPEIDTTLLVPVMMGMLGLGAMRSYEKVNSVAREK